MLTNFEEITIDLTNEELLILPHLVKGFKLHNESNPIKSHNIIQAFNSYLKTENIKYNLTDVKLRKFCNHIRTHSIIPLIATSNGYYVSYNDLEIEQQIKSLKERARSILQCAEGLEKILKQKNS